MEIDFDALKQPVSAEGGPGPDLSDDPGFAEFEADVEGFFPSRADDYYYSFRNGNGEIEGFAARCLALLQRSRDLRLLVTLAKLGALGGNIGTARGAVGLVRHFLEGDWEGIHPTATGSGYNLRGVTVERLDEFAAFVLPLQYAPLISDRNGHLCFRDHAVATGAVTPRDDDTHPTAADIARILERCEIGALVAARDLAAGMQADLVAIGRLWSANCDDPPSLAFRRLAPMLERMTAFLDEAVTERDPSLALGGAAAGAEAVEAGSGVEAGGEPAAATEGAAETAAAKPAGPIMRLADARAALHAASRYFEIYEPSSPAFLLARKAENLVGLTFPQVLQQIAPDRVYDTAIQLGPRRNLPLPLEKLTEEFGEVELERAEETESAAEFDARDRASAMALLAEVARWYRTAEPSNPIPLLLDKARELTSKDFAALLSEIALPES